MSELKYKIGDKVRIKSLDWYNENKNSVDNYDVVFANGWVFSKPMSNFCGKELIIEKISHATNPPHYIMKDTMFAWTDEMIEGLVEEPFLFAPNITEGFFIHEKDMKWTTEYILPEGYIFKDENGNEIHTTKIVLEKANTLKIQSNNMETETHRGYCTTEEETTNKSKKVAWFTFEDNDFADKVELALSNRELIQEDGKWFVVKKKKEYPKNYAECCKVLGVDPDNYLTIRNVHFYDDDKELVNYESDLLDKFHSLWKLRICRDAYWKIYGDEMRLGKPWEPDWNNISDKYCIYFVSGHAWSKECQTRQCPFAFPTPEMRDAFKENFDPDIEICKELL